MRYGQSLLNRLVNRIRQGIFVNLIRLQSRRAALLPIQFNGGIIQADNLACVAIVNYGVSFHFIFKC